MHIVVTVTAAAAVVARESAMKLRVHACVRERVCVCVRVETKDWTAYFLCVGSLSDEFFSRWTIFQEMLLLSIYVTFHL